MTAIVDILSDFGVNTKNAITWLLQNIFQKFKKYSYIACQDLTNDTGFSIL